jgi:sulfonate transport system ATP-binding protein
MQINSLEQAQVKAVAAIAKKAVVSRGVQVAIKGISKSYGGRHVLESVDLTIKSGEFVAVVGRSGCGKSTLLRLIAGLESATSGAIGFGKNDSGAKTQPETRVMFQDSRLLPWKSVLKNVSIGLPKIADRATGVLRQVGLEDRANEWPAVLSGGQRQRVALARALLHEPNLLLLDEPLGALDALTRIEMQQLIESIWQQKGFTALLVTHDVQEAIALADRVVLIEDGKITLDEQIALPRPRSRGNALFAQLEEKILARVLKQSASRPDTALGDISLSRTVNQVAWAI